MIATVRPSSDAARRNRSHGVETLAIGDREVAIDVLAHAFCDNPINRAVIGGDSRRRLRITRSGMRASLAATHGIAEVTTIPAPEAGAQAMPRAVLVGFPPGAYPAPPPPVSVQLRCLIGQGLRVVFRWGKVHDALLSRHPAEPHAYLALLGVHPDLQRRGLGFRLLEDWLAGVDAIGVPAYLETDRREALPMYRRVGFEIVDELALFETRVFCLQR